jgi:hypothetical protein
LHYTRRYFAKETTKASVLFGTFEFYINKYLHARDKQRHSWLGFFECPQDEYVIIGTLFLADSFWGLSSVWEGFYDSKKASSEDENVSGYKDEEGSNSVNGYKNDKEEEICAADPQHYISNGLAQTSLHTKNSFVAMEEDFPMLLCMAVLHYGLDKTSTHSQMRLLLTKCYIRSGAVGPAMEILSALDLKHIQLESVGYIYLWKLISLGHYEEGLRSLRNLENFYTTYEKEVRFPFNPVILFILHRTMQCMLSSAHSSGGQCGKDSKTRKHVYP